MTDDTLAAQLAFVLEADQLKAVERQTTIADRSRRENSAEHSWTLALMAIVLADAAPPEVNVDRVIKMVVLHDLVEIDAGDTFVYDDALQAGKAEREQAAADRLFGMLPSPQGAELRALWEEFDARDTADAKFAAALDRLSPLMLNRASGGLAWKRHGIVESQVRARNAHIAEGSLELWVAAQHIIDQAVDDGLLPDH
ncbi:MAG: HD domain-containing protein [Acidimicrobiia bacterium]